MAVNLVMDYAQQQTELQKGKNFFSIPGDKAVDLYRGGDCSWIKNVGARALSVAQVIFSLVAVPFALFAMIFGPVITLFTHNSTIAREWAAGCAGMAGEHLFRIPESIIGAFFPSILTKSVGRQGTDLVEMVQQGQARRNPNLGNAFQGLGGLEGMMQGMGPDLMQRAFANYPGMG